VSDFLHYPTREHRTRVLVLAFLLISLVSGAGYYWSRTPTVLLTLDRQTRSIRSNAKTVRDFLIEQHIALNAADIVTPDLTTALTRDLSIRVTRITVHNEKVTLDIPLSIAWQVRTRQNLRRILVQKGLQNQRKQTVRVTLADGKEIERKVTVEKLIRKPLYTLTLLDDKDRPLKTYDLNKCKHVKMLATAYYVGDPMVPGDTTYLGHKLQRGLVAIDPTVLPLGWRLYIPGYGYAYSSDTGSAIKGLRIDLAVKNSAEERRYNHRQVTIYLLEKSKKW